MRIAVVSPHLPTPVLPMRGVRHSEQLRLFAAIGHEVRAVVPLSVAPWRASPKGEQDGPIFVAHPRYFRPPRSLRSVGLLLERRLFARAATAELGDPDVVLVHSATLPGALVGRTGRAPLVITLHDHELFELAPRSALLRRAIARSLRGADCAVYVSDALHREGQRLAGPHRARVIPIGIDTWDDLVAAPPADFTVSCVARLIPRKRVDVLIRAFARVLATRPEARLVVVGEGPERRALERLAERLRVRDRVEFAGELDRHAALDRIARSNVMALPSVLESLGAVYLEAMSLGVPAVGTAGEGIAAYIEHGVDGILVPKDDEGRLYAELLALAAEPERARRLGTAGRRRFLASALTWRANVTAHLQLFAELQADGPRRRRDPRAGRRT
jgi:glycosyltransferase involved in cell wall biosynthesis